ncbi:hypothetical protein [Desulfohalovibrio reitneri]|uniref:hypothetical protein n=1 Tax=Desulfohalovibrio reitneri TaxID=1307759 RepID=UPI0004A73F1C|nr:hypothetical protein [Desulfohalovibrio reitneri]
MSCVFVFNDERLDTATLTASTEDAAWPVVNAQTPDRLQVWKSTSDPAWIRVDYGSPVPLSALALVEHNLVPPAEVVLRRYPDDTWTTPDYEEIWPAWEGLLGWGQGDWGQVGWGGYPAQDDLADFPRVTTMRLLGKAISARYVEVELRNGGTPPSLGRLILARHWSPRCGVDVKLEMELVDPTEVSRADDGHAWRDVRPQYYQVKFDLRRLPEGDYFNNLQKLQRMAGNRRESVLQLLTKNPQRRAYTTLYGSVPGGVTFKGEAPGVGNVKLTFEESI